MKALVFPLINFVLLLGILYFLLKDKVVHYVQLRHDQIRNLVDQVRKQLLESKKEYEEYTAKLKAIDSEIEHLKSSAVRDAQSRRDSIVQRAEASTASLVSDAQKNAQTLKEDLKRSLATTMADQVLQRAEVILQSELTHADQQRIRGEFSSRVAGGEA